MELYDAIGSGYAERRKEDPRIAERIAGALGSSRSIVNVGAGTGSYEPRGRRLVAVELPELLEVDRRTVLSRIEDLDSGLSRLRADLASGAWHR